MIVTCEQMQQAEAALFRSGRVDAETLMEKAAGGCTAVVCEYFPRPGKARLFVGKGNNGGDALVIGRLLRERGWQVDAIYAGEIKSELARKKQTEFEAIPDGNGAGDFTVLIDGLLGIGAKGPLRGEIGEAATRLSQSSGMTFAVDIPSGLNGDTGEPYEGAVIADVTLSIARVKSGLIADTAVSHVGRIATIPLPEIEFPEQSGPEILSSDLLVSRVPRRRFGWHKGDAGRVLIIAGSRGLTGAAHLTALGASKGGAGLVTVLAKEDTYEILASRLPPEVMVKPVRSFAEASDIRADVLAVGPGLGDLLGDEAALCNLIQQDERPIVVDADALNLLARHQPLGKPGGPRLFTPHPGEIARWIDPADKTRLETARTFAAEHPQITLLYKGARTLIFDPASDRLAYNTSGHPGMACGGMGDVLTGLTAALIGQGADPYDAACLGSWLIGRAAEKAIFGNDERISPQSLTAEDVANYLGAAFRDLDDTVV